MTPAPSPWKKPCGPSWRAISRREESRLAYTFLVPWAAKRVRRRSNGYVVVVATPPAKAPDMNDCATSGMSYGVDCSTADVER